MNVLPTVYTRKIIEFTAIDIKIFTFHGPIFYQVLMTMGIVIRTWYH